MEKRRRHLREAGGTEAKPKTLAEKILGTGRQRFLRIGLASAAALTLGLGICQFAPKKSFGEMDSQGLISAYYPELKGRAETSSDQFMVGERRVRVLNFTPMVLNSQNAEAKYRFFGQLPNELPNIPFERPGSGTVFVLKNQPNTDRLVSIVPFSQRPPDWSATIPSQINQAGTGISRSEPRIKMTYLRVTDQEIRDLDGNEMHLPFDPNDNFDIEACQSSVSVVAPNPELQMFAQELVCNSAGLASSYSSRGRSYGDYLSIVGMASTAFRLPVPVISQEIFNKMAPTGKVLSKI